jgi:hypothetical protein
VCDARKHVTVRLCLVDEDAEREFGIRVLEQYVYAGCADPDKDYLFSFYELVYGVRDCAAEKPGVSNSLCHLILEMDYRIDCLLLLGLSRLNSIFSASGSTGTVTMAIMPNLPFRADGWLPDALD